MVLMYAFTWNWCTTVPCVGLYSQALLGYPAFPNTQPLNSCSDIALLTCRRLRQCKLQARAATLPTHNPSHVTPPRPTNSHMCMSGCSFQVIFAVLAALELSSIYAADLFDGFPMVTACCAWCRASFGAMPGQPHLMAGQQCGAGQVLLMVLSTQAVPAQNGS